MAPSGGVLLLPRYPRAVRPRGLHVSASLPPSTEAEHHSSLAKLGLAPRQGDFLCRGARTDDRDAP